MGSFSPPPPPPVLVLSGVKEAASILLRFLLPPCLRSTRSICLLFLCRRCCCCCCLFSPPTIPLPRRKHQCHWVSISLLIVLSLRTVSLFLMSSASVALSLGQSTPDLLAFASLCFFFSSLCLAPSSALIFFLSHSNSLYSRKVILCLGLKMKWWRRFMFRSIKASPAGHVTTGSFYLALVFRFRRSNYTGGAVSQTAPLSWDTSTLSWPLPNSWKQSRHLFRWHGRHHEERESYWGWK